MKKLISKSKIRLLDEAIVHRIAAGEVVDRPASLLKELVENSLDAGAKNVRVLLVEGGVDLIEVDDDGIGMGLEDLNLCLARHATSKISNIEDLDAVGSLGFRGEALAAISSVSRLEIESCQRGSKEAWKLISENNQSRTIPFTRKEGTLLRVKELFYNTPARKKFLKAPGSEAAACVQNLWALAMSHPEISFEWHVANAKGEIKEQVQMKSEAARDRFQRSLPCDVELIEVFSRAPAPELKSISMLAARAPVSFRSQKHIHLFVNGRSIQDKKLSYALREAYSGLIEMGCFPAVWIDVEVEPSVVDVNIHPQKKELRWPKGFSLGSVAYHTLRPHLETRKSPSSPVYHKSRELFSTFAGAASQFVHDRDAEMLSEHGRSNVMDAYNDFYREPPDREEAHSKDEALESTDLPFRFRDLRVVGEVGASWLVLEAPEGMVIVDQHAAHERINFEKILNSKELLRAKPLLLPMALKLPLAVSDYKEEVIEALESLSFECAESSLAEASQIEVIAVPESDRKLNWGELLEELFSRIEEHTGADALKVQIEAKIAASLACHGSVRSGQRLKSEQIKALLSDLDDVEWGAFCPHGRPVWSLLRHQDLENLFHRS